MIQWHCSKFYLWLFSVKFQTFNLMEYSIDIMGYIPYTKGGVLLQIFEVNFYTKQDETCPLTQFLDSLEPKKIS